MSEEVVYCGRCDRPYKAANRRLAMGRMLRHMKKAHPDYYETYKEQ